jgi:alanine dehydrogenase
MIIGIPKEIKSGERRVAIDPYWTNQYVGRGHEVLIEKNAGLFSGFEDKAYKQAGGQILDRRATLWSRADLIAKFKEIQKEEYPLMHEGQIITCFFHLAEDVNPEMCGTLKSSKVTTFSLEQLVTREGLRPAVAPMSEMAGWIAAIQMTKLLFEPPDSIGLALASFSGAGAPRVTVLGGGVVGYFAAKTLLGIGADVTILERDFQRVMELNRLFEGRVRILFSNDGNLRKSLKESVGLINAVYPTPDSTFIVKKEHINLLPERGVVVDVGGGGIVETTHYTTLDNPTYVEEGRIHYCVDNTPALIPRVSSKLFIDLSMPYVMEIADKGVDRAVKENPTIGGALNYYKGRLVNQEVAIRQNLEVEPYSPGDA